MGELGEGAGRDVADDVPAEDRSAGPASPVDPWATFDRWSSNLFLVLALLGLLVALAVSGLGAATNPPEALLAALAIAAITLAVLVTTSMGLDRGRAWARPAAVGLLWVLVVTGVIGAIVDLTRSTITFPIGAIAAAVVLTKRPRPLPRAASRDLRIATLLVLVLLATSAVGAAAALLGARPA